MAVGIMDRFRVWASRRLVKGLAGAAIPEWIRATFVEPTWRSIVQEGYKANSAFFSCVSMWAFAFPEPRLKVYDVSRASRSLVERHPLYTLLNRPAPDLSQRELWQIAITYLVVGGKCMILKRRTVGGKVAQLVPYHAGQIRPVGEGSPWPESFRFTDGQGRERTLPKEDVIYLRWLADPERVWDGIAPAVAAARDVDADNEAARYMYTLLKNDAIPRVALTLPPGVTLDDDQWARQRAQWQDRYGDDRRGTAAILEGGMGITPLSLQLDQLSFEALRRVPETRICAAMRVPPILVGLLSGLTNSTYSNYAQARLSYTQDSLVPMWRYIADEITAGLQGEADLLEDGLALDFDLSDVGSLQESQASKIGALTQAVQGRWMTPDEARVSIGLPPIPGGNVLLPLPSPTPLSVRAVSAGTKSHTYYGFTDDEVEEALNVWDDEMPDVAGLLDAVPLEDEDEE